MTDWGPKLTAAAILFVLAVGPCILSGHLAACTACSPRTVVPIANLVTSGVFLASGLLVMLRESVEALAIVSYPLAEVIGGTVFLALHTLSAVFASHTLSGSHRDACSVQPVASTASDSSINYLTDFPPDTSITNTTSLLRPASTLASTVSDTSSQDQKALRTTTVVLFCVLCAHSLFEGIALGTVSDSDAVVTFIAICSHMSVAAFALGGKLNEAFPARWLFASLAVGFSLCAPLGVVIGTLITSDDSTTTDIIGGVFNAIAFGTFLHVSVHELQGAMSARRPTVAMMVAVTSGFGLIALISVWL
jgi:zinc transporter ZupT